MNPVPSADPNDLLTALQYPVDTGLVRRKRIAIGNLLSSRPAALTVRIAIIGGSTTSELKASLGIFLLNHRIKPIFHEGDYARFWEEGAFENPSLDAFNPEIVYIHTTWRNIVHLPPPQCPASDFEAAVGNELGRFRLLWNELQRKYRCTVIQNNFDLPPLRPLGSFEASSYGTTAFVDRLNFEFARVGAETHGLRIHDIHSLSAEIGLSNWFDADAWYSYKMAVSPSATVLLAKSLAGLVNAIYGKSKKCLILDLDNTLWGGVVGDDGAENLTIGTETALAESYTAFQKYALDLKRRGVLLAVCSKNDESTAMEGLLHPSGLLRPEDFAVIRANWLPKHENIADIARTLNIGCDSCVFVDDNPAEREIVRRNLPEVAVPEVGSDVSRFPLVLDREGYFETVGISLDDLNRSAYYARDAGRTVARNDFSTYEDYLSSLDMTAEIKPFSSVYIDRITQLINKTNQFNLTTRRCTQTEIRAAADDPRFIHLYGRLTDRFGDNGLVTVVMGEVEGDCLNVLLWLMSCRVLKRGMEFAMMDALVEQCALRNLGSIRGTYIPTQRNAMVERFYSEMGFTEVGSGGDVTEWRLDIPTNRERRNKIIRRME